MGELKEAARLCRLLLSRGGELCCCVMSPYPRGSGLDCPLCRPSPLFERCDKTGPRACTRTQFCGQGAGLSATGEPKAALGIGGRAAWAQSGKAGAMGARFGDTSVMSV